MGKLTVEQINTIIDTEQSNWARYTPEDDSWQRELQEQSQAAVRLALNNVRRALVSENVDLEAEALSIVRERLVVGQPMQKITWIKTLREETGAGIKESKDAIEYAIAKVLDDLMVALDEQLSVARRASSLWQERNPF